MSKYVKSENHTIRQSRFYFVHGSGVRTLALLGTQPMFRSLKLAGLPEVDHFDLRVEFFDLEGRPVAEHTQQVFADQEVMIDSGDVFDEAATGTKVEGSGLLSTLAIHFNDSVDAKPPASLSAVFSGVFLLFRANNFVTGVHLQHGVEFRPWKDLVKFYARRLARRASEQSLLTWRDPSRLFAKRPWPLDAIGAGVVHAAPSSGTTGFLVMHNDNYAPGLGFVESRNERREIRHFRLPSLKPNATFKGDVEILGRSSRGNGGQAWAQLLCVYPPQGVSTIFAGERFSDGSFCIDHTYYQQPRNSRNPKAREVKLFARRLLRDGVIGPSHPWPCVHNERVESLIAVCNQLYPEEEHTYDLRVFDTEGKLMLEKLACIHVKPFGFELLNVSEELRQRGIRELDGTYLITHSAASPSELLPNRLHAQGIYRFDGRYWNGVQSDASIWSSPEPKIPEMEQLSWAKVRHKQYWFAPVIESDELETVIPVANLSYSLRYDQAQTLCLRYCEGGREIRERDIELKPFGSARISVRDLFGDCMTQPSDGKPKTGEIIIYPKTGITYCASFMIRDKSSGVFVLEHVLPVPKFPHEKAV